MIFYALIALLLVSCAPKLEEKAKYSHKYPEEGITEVER